MDHLAQQTLLENYGERVRRMGLFEPLHDLERKREQDGRNQPLDLKGMGLLTLLFFFEKKLLRQYKTGAKELADYLQLLTKDVYLLSDAQYLRIAKTLIETFRPSTGRKRTLTYFDWEEKKEKTLHYAMLKANDFDEATQTQYYTLDEDGLALLFATKEFYAEFQLSISQLMLRKQLEKGEFRGALRQISEMRIDVETLEERIQKLKHEIQRSIVSEETFLRYQKLLEDIYARLHREGEEFKELRQFVKETRERLYAKDLHLKEQTSYGLLLQITSGLEAVHYSHTSLLDKTLDLKNMTLLSAQESLYFTGIDVFNFDQDLVSYMISTPLPMEAEKGLLAPFLKVEETRTWSPFSLLAEQLLVEEEEEKEEKGLLEALAEEEKMAYIRETGAFYALLMEHLLEALKKGEASSLKAFLSYLEKGEDHDFVEHRWFYQFFLLLHQYSPLQAEDPSEMDEKSVLPSMLHLLSGYRLTLEETKEILHPTKRYSITNFNITLQEI